MADERTGWLLDVYADIAQGVVVWLLVTMGSVTSYSSP